MMITVTIVLVVIIKSAVREIIESGRGQFRDFWRDGRSNGEAGEKVSERRQFRDFWTLPFPLFSFNLIFGTPPFLELSLDFLFYYLHFKKIYQIII